MDPTWEFQAPQFVDFNNLGAAEDSNVDEFFNVDMESGEHWVTAVSSPGGGEDMELGALDSPLQQVRSCNDRTFQVSVAVPIPPPKITLNFPPKRPSNMVTSWGNGHVIKTSGTGINLARTQAHRIPAGKIGLMTRKVGTPRRNIKSAMAVNIVGKNSPKHQHRTPRRLLAFGTSRLGAGTPKRLGTNCQEPRLAVARPRTQVQRSLNTPTASRIRRKSKSPSLPLPFPATPDVVKRFKNKLLGAELRKVNDQPIKQSTAKFKSQAEQIISFQRSTPSRFRTRPQPPVRPRLGSIPHNPVHAAGARPRLATVPTSPNLATKGRNFNKRKATVVETLVDKTHVKAVQIEAGGKRMTITIPEPFKLKTEMRAGERGQFEMMKRQKETAAEEERMLGEERKLKEEQDNLVIVRKSLVHKAQPIRNYKPMAIKRSDKKLTLPASPTLGVVVRGSGK